MKATKFLLSLLVVSLLAGGCTNKYVTEEYILEGLDMTLIDFTVKNNNWGYREVEYGNEDEGYFEAILEVPEITKDVIEQGVVMVYRRFNDGGSTIWTPLPAQRTEKTSDGLYYTTFVDFEYSLGRVNIFVTATDLYAGVKPGDMTFRVAIQL